MTGEKWSNLPHQPSTIENYRPKFHVVIAVKWDIRVLWKENQRWSRNVSDATLGTGTRVSIPSPRARPVAHKVTGKNRGWLPGLQMVYADKMKKKRREWRAEIERAEVNRSIEKKKTSWDISSPPSWMPSSGPRLAITATPVRINFL